MTPHELRDIIARLDRTQAEAGELIGVGERAVQMYLAGQRQIPPAAAALLRLFVAGKIDERDLVKALKRGLYAPWCWEAPRK